GEVLLERADPSLGEALRAHQRTLRRIAVAAGVVPAHHELDQVGKREVDLHEPDLTELDECSREPGRVLEVAHHPRQSARLRPQRAPELALVTRLQQASSPLDLLERRHALCASAMVGMIETGYVSPFLGIQRIARKSSAVLGTSRSLSNVRT